jgi:hypothetical protein
MPADPGEIHRLRTALRDLVALSTNRAAWVGKEPPAIAAGLADVLVGSFTSISRSCACAIPTAVLPSTSRGATGGKHFRNGRWRPAQDEGAREVHERCRRASTGLPSRIRSAPSTTTTSPRATPLMIWVRSLSVMPMSRGAPPRCDAGSRRTRTSRLGCAGSRPWAPQQLRQEDFAFRG